MEVSYNKISKPGNQDIVHRLQLEAVDSTNNFLKQYTASCPDLITLVTAEYQTAGRGSASNTWESEAGKNLLFSLLVHPMEVRAEHMFVLSEVLALAVCGALNEYESGFQIKWPNDIYYADKKVAGMLIENHLRGATISRSVMGVGLNVNQQTFLSDAPNPCSLVQILGHEVDREDVLQKVMQHFVQLYGRLGVESEYKVIHESYLKMLYRLGERHEFRDEHGTFWATMVDVHPSGHLILKEDDCRIRKYAFKEVQYII